MDQAGSRLRSGALERWDVTPACVGAEGSGFLIYETVHGSRAYGLHRAGSDEDLKGIAGQVRRTAAGRSAAR